MDSAGTGARRRPVAGRSGGPDSGSGDAGTGVITSSVPHLPAVGAVVAAIVYLATYRRPYLWTRSAAKTAERPLSRK